MSAPKMALMTIVAGRQPPSLDQAAASLGVSTADLNADFGVVPIDPQEGLYAVEVRADRLPQQQPDRTTPYRGPFSTPRIEPFGGPPAKGPSSKGRKE